MGPQGLGSMLSCACLVPVFVGLRVFCACMRSHLSPEVYASGYLLISASVHGSPEPSAISFVSHNNHGEKHWHPHEYQWISP